MKHDSKIKLGVYKDLASDGVPGTPHMTLIRHAL